MNILLLYPEFPDTFWSFKHALKFIRKQASLPPLGLLTVSSMLPDTWQRKLVDLNTGDLTSDDLEWADMVFISAMAVQKSSAEELIARCRESAVLTVAGGPLFTSEPDVFPDVDHFVLNEAEITLPQFLDDLDKGQLKRFYRSDSFADIMDSPVPDWSLLTMKNYASMAIQFSRGCPYKCDFCNVTTLFGRKIRTKTSRQIIGELDALKQNGWQDSIFFVDDNFIAHKAYLKKELLPALIEWQATNRSTAKLYTECSINIADDPELMDLMVKAGFNQVFIGIETPDSSALEACGKQHNSSRDLLRDIKTIQRAGLEVQGGFIVGFDTDTPSIFRRQIEFIQQSGIVTAMVGMLQALPGTGLYERMKQEGRLRCSSTGDNADSTTNIVPKMDIDILRQGYRDMMTSLYSPENYYQRIKTLLQEYRPPKFRSRFRPDQLLALGRSMIALGIVGSERLHYWKMLIWTLFRQHRSLSLAITLSIYGHHFRKVCLLHLNREEDHAAVQA
ncbi:MAG: DUF4070 domain-containing protein [Prosthecochloris sp.]|uniref:B12-binding domain-containing radical SAM protein n=1 Tax=Prosthecochloris sp. ZM_2 TaxID=2045206 RepID=UPI000DF79A72|nr:B12-binding domain-containing radical SAM protein [Prosthecochloris sp. ZM_2]MEC9486543.1 DUF4070 domain-containing protein [Prosthecochloris sp.]RNA65455.1 DUF4070 domain-containing protein [Prosthecochloris sp. ZM_2]